MNPTLRLATPQNIQALRNEGYQLTGLAIGDRKVLERREPPARDNREYTALEKARAC